MEFTIKELQDLVIFCGGDKDKVIDYIKLLEKKLMKKFKKEQDDYDYEDEDEMELLKCSFNFTKINLDI
jgi:hypothetical protein